MLTIRQNGDRWELCRDDTVLEEFGTYGDAVAVVAAMLATSLAAEPGSTAAQLATTGILPERWRSDLCFAEETGDGRNFTDCEWTSRDPGQSVMPLMFQTAMEYGHFGAQLAGYFEGIDNLGQGSNPTGEGLFYDSDAGRQLRDMLLGGRRFGVSVDPGAVALEEECLDVDDDGWCVDWRLNFLAYEIIGVTATPFPGFARAAIWLDGAPAEAGGEDDEEAVAAAAGSPHVAQLPAGTVVTRVVEHAAGGTCCASCAAARRRTPVVAAGVVAPPAAHFVNPQFTQLTAMRVDDDHVFGHLAPWGQCHTGYMNRCVETPRSLTGYANFHRGYVVCDDGTEVATGPITVGTGHPDLSLSFRGAVEHYDHTGTAIADVVAGEDAHGVWIAGSLRPGVTDEQVRTLRASSLSGDWRPHGRGLELMAALAVNSPGFPIARVAGGRVVGLVAAGAAAVAALDHDDPRYDGLVARMRALEATMARPHRDRLRQVRRDVATARLRG